MASSRLDQLQLAFHGRLTAILGFIHFYMVFYFLGLGQSHPTVANTPGMSEGMVELTWNVSEACLECQCKWKAYWWETYVECDLFPSSGSISSLYIWNSKLCEKLYRIIKGILPAAPRFAPAAPEICMFYFFVMVAIYVFSDSCFVMLVVETCLHLCFGEQLPQRLPALWTTLWRSKWALAWNSWPQSTHTNI